MPALESLRQHPLRWITLAIVALLVALIVAIVIYVHAQLQPQRFTALLESTLSSAGLTLKLQAPAEPVLFPHPGVELQGFSLTNAGSSTPWLTANSATIVVPWRALLHGEVAIERVDIDTPHIDLAGLETLLGRLPHHQGPPRLPAIATGVHMRNGTLATRGQPLLSAFSLDTGALTPGQPFHLDASARTVSGRIISASLATVPMPPRDGAIEFTSIRMNLSERDGISLQLQGNGQWHGGTDLAMQLKGTLQHVSLAPASATSAGKTPAKSVVANHATIDQVALDLTPARGAEAMTATLKLDGPDAHVDLRMQPTQFGTWWNRVLAVKPTPPAIPMPLSGTAKVQQLDLGWMQASGVTLEAGPDVAPPASAASAASAGSAAATMR